MKLFFKAISAAMCVVALSSCKTQEKMLYFQDVPVNTTETVNGERDIKLQPKDQISIIVNSKDPRLAILFNLTTARYQAGQSDMSYGRNGEISGYTLDDNGDIDFPVIGKVHIADMTKSQVAAFIKSKLVESNMINDPVVTVEFMNLYFSVLGEVNKPGKYMITKDQINLLEALSMAGDLSVYGVRDGIYVVREEAGKRTTYNVDIRKKSLFDSPAYYLKQNDVIYVQPNKTKTKNSNIGNSTSLMVSATSVLVSVATLVVNVIRINK